ncbi:hypothetical protein ACIBLB_40315 [Streptosporangium canum]|uniref:hypothetical protein n=1 Tax=Streptosporangium canum TaxID=324952 RepID=UPI00378DD575
MVVGPRTRRKASRHASTLFLAAARAAYADGSSLRVRSSGIVHEVAMTKWFADECMPGPACMVGVSGWDPGAAHPDRGAVTRRPCLKLTHTDPASEQLELFPEPELVGAVGGGPDLRHHPVLGPQKHAVVGAGAGLAGRTLLSSRRVLELFGQDTHLAYHREEEAIVRRSLPLCRGSIAS